MIQFIKRRWFWLQVWLGWRKAPPPVTPLIIAREALALLERNLTVGVFLRSPATHLVFVEEEPPKPTLSPHQT